MMKLLFVGDVVGNVGCQFVLDNLYKIKKEHNIDITVINGENSAQGNGITKYSSKQLFQAGADIITTGNHCFKRREALEIYENDAIIRPANFPEGCVGRGICRLDLGRTQIAVVNLMGTTYMDPLDNPFTVIENILEDMDTPNIFVDFHGEATAEKKAMGHFLTGKVTAMFGTHTHVQTADEIILSKHTAYITDTGMTGPELSVLGVETEPALKRFRFRFPDRFSEAQTPCFLNGVVVEFDEKSGRAISIERVTYR